MKEIAVIALIKVISVVSGYVMQKKLVTVHTVINKVTGALLFMFPMTILIIDLKFSSIIACTVATFAAVQEGHYIRTGKG